MEMRDIFTLFLHAIAPLSGSVNPVCDCQVRVDATSNSDSESRSEAGSQPSVFRSLEFAYDTLNIALQRYPGTLLLMTHDHDVIDEVATRIWHFEGGNIEDFKGTYAQFLSQIEQLV